MRRAALLLLLAGCGGSPTAPTSPVQVSDIRNGITGAPVAGTVTPLASGVSISAPGFLLREQQPSSTVYLWPQSEDYVRAVVYSYGIASGNVPSPGMLRWLGPITIALGPSLAGDPKAEAWLASSVSEMSRWASVMVGQPANVTVDISRAETPADAMAMTSYTVSGQTIVSAKVRFADRPAFTQSILLHELGHVLGLSGHSPILSDTMSVDPGRNASGTFGPQESDALTMMYRHRSPGNRFPDRAPEVASASLRTVVVID